MRLRSLWKTTRMRGKRVILFYCSRIPNSMDKFDDHSYVVCISILEIVRFEFEGSPYHYSCWHEHRRVSRRDFQFSRELPGGEVAPRSVSHECGSALKNLRFVK